MSSRSKVPSGATSSSLYKHCIKVLFFVVTFLVFVALQNSFVYLEALWLLLQRELSGVSWWILCLAAIGTIPVFWIVILGVHQIVERLSGGSQNYYDYLNTDSESDDALEVEAGRRFHERNRQEFSNKQISPSFTSSPAHGPVRSSQSNSGARGKSHNGNTYAGAQSGRPQTGNDDDSQNPTDVDVTVHPVDTTIAAGGDARVSPTYNVSLMSFANDNPQGHGEGSYDKTRLYPQFYPSAPPTMQGGPAYFKRSF